MAKKSRKKNEDPKALYLAILWAVIAGVWLLVAASLASYNAADPPAHAYGVPNETIHNWVGNVGALISHKVYLMAGPGAWVMLLGVGVMLLMTGIGRAVTQPVIRIVGLVVMSISISALVSVAAPTVVHGFSGAPQGPGGLLAQLIDDQLTTRFAVPGTVMILVVCFWVGAVLAADQWVLAAPKAMGGAILKLTHVSLPTVRVPQLVGRFPAVTLPWGRGSAESQNKGKSKKSGRSRRRKDEDLVIDEDAGGLGATQSFGMEDEPEVYEEDEYEEDEYEEEEYEEEEPEEEEADEEVEEEVADAGMVKKKQFSTEELRAKMQQLPINFAPKVNTAKAAPLREVDLSGYEFPTMDMLIEPESNFTEEMEQIVRDQALELESAFAAVPDRGQRGWDRFRAGDHAVRGKACAGDEGLAAERRQLGPGASAQGPEHPYRAEHGGQGHGWY